MTATLDQTIREIVATDFRTAAVFQRHGIDFCCNGNRTVELGCREAGAHRLRGASRSGWGAGGAGRRGAAFASWDAPQLVRHIIDDASRLRPARPCRCCCAIPRKVADVHGERHPELVHIARLFERIAAEMSEHMAKEEQILFPYILALATPDEEAPFAPFGSVQHPIRMMEAEHRFVGDAMGEIRQLTDGYTLPDDACTTYRVCFQELEAFEADLFTHVHLENNVLFPKAAALEGTL